MKNQLNVKKSGIRFVFTFFLLFTSCLIKSSNNPVDSQDNNSPSAVTQYNPILKGDSIVISWSCSTDPKFASYRVYRGTTISVDTNSFLAAKHTSIIDTTLTDFGISGVDTTYYTVCVFNTSNNYAASSVKFVTGYNLAPPPERPK